MIEILLAIVAAVVYSLSGYLKNVGEKIDPVQIITTVIVGAIIGSALYLAQIPVTAETVAAQVLAYAGLIVIIENIVKAVYRRIVKNDE